MDPIISCSSLHLNHLIVLILKNKLYPELIQIICNMYLQITNLTDSYIICNNEREIIIKCINSNNITFKTSPIDSKNISIRTGFKGACVNIDFGLDKPCQELHNTIKDIDSVINKREYYTYLTRKKFTRIKDDRKCKTSIFGTSCHMEFDTKYGNYTKVIDKQTGKSLIEHIPLYKYNEIFEKYKQIEILFEWSSIVTDPFFQAEFTVKTMICS